MKIDKVYLEQILDAVSKIKAFTMAMNRESFLKDQKTQSAVIMQLALIGELAKRISKPTRSSIDIPWKAISGFRDRAIHDYYQIDVDIVWYTIKNDLKELKKKVIVFIRSL